jgi:hypothetical protein
VNGWGEEIGSVRLIVFVFVFVFVWHFSPIKDRWIPKKSNIFCAWQILLLLPHSPLSQIQMKIGSQLRLSLSLLLSSFDSRSQHPRIAVLAGIPTRDRLEVFAEP